MSDQINDVLAFTALNLAISATSAPETNPIDVSGFERGVSIAWNVVAQTGTSINDIVIFEGDTSGGVFTPITDEARFIFPELYVKEFGTDGLLRLTAATGTNTLVSHFGLRDLKRFLKIGISTTVTMAGTTNILVNVFLRTESSPVRKNQVGFDFFAP